MAQVIATKILKDKGLGNKFRVVSAGTSAWPGSTASPEAVAVLAMQDMDLKQHRAQSLSAEMAEEADIILTMTENHKHNVLWLVPEAAERTFTLKEYVLEKDGQALDGTFNLDISDPFGQGLEVYQACAAELQEQIDKAVERLINEIKQADDNPHPS